MLYLIKSLFRYTFKNKLSTFLLTILLFISVFLLLTLSFMSSNMNNSYNHLVNEGNLANIVINENYSPNVIGENNLTEEEAKAKNEAKFKEKLQEMNLEFRDFLSLNYTNTSNHKSCKVVSYDNSYQVNKLVIYEGSSIYDDTWDLTTIVDNAMWTNDGTDAAIARRTLVYLATLAYWTDSEVWGLFNRNTNANPNGDNSTTTPCASLMLKENDEPSDLFYDPKSWTGHTNNKIKKVAKYIQCWLDPTQTYYRPLINKGYKLNFEIYVSSTNPKVIGNIFNHSSRFAVVPNYVLKAQNKKIISDDWYQEIKKNITKDNYISQIQFENYIEKNIPDEYKVYVDSMPYIIVGSGMTPDFMYPVYSFEKLTPNINEEVLIYTSKAGYQVSLDANRSNPTSSYIVAKANNNVNYYLKKINEIIPNYMTTGGKTWAFLADDTANTFEPVGLRLQFLPNIINMQVIVSNLLTIFILVLTIIIFIIAIKKFVSDNQVNIAILRSNGYQKRSIILSTSLFSLLPCMVAGILGYILSFFLQSVAFSLYQFNWVLPISFISFSAPILLGSILVPFALFFFITIISTLFIIKKNPTSLMSESSKFVVSKLSKWMIRPLPKLNILPKFRLSIAFSSISRLIVLIVMLSLTSTALMFAFASNNKFEDAKTITYVDKNYNMGFDLITPTVQGGQYFRTTFDNAGKMIFDENKKLLNYNVAAIDNYSSIRGINTGVSKIKDDTAFFSYFEEGNVNEFAGAYANNHWPSMNDSTWQEKDFNYLKNKVEVQYFVDVSLGSGTNPWDIARSLAPTNVQNYSNNLTKELWEKSINDSNLYFTNATKDLFEPWSNTRSLWLITLSNWDKIVDKTIYEIFSEQDIIKEVDPQKMSSNDIYFQHYETGKYYQADTAKYLLGIPTGIKDIFLIVGSYLFSNLYGNEKSNAPDYSNYFYKLLYNYVPMDEEDETYTFVNAKCNINNYSNDIKITGIKPSSKFIELKDDKGNDLNDLLWINEDEKEQDILLRINEDEKKQGINSKQYNKIHGIYDEINLDNGYFPIIINESAKFQYNIDVGDVILVDPSNEATRYNINNVFGSDINNQVYKFKVAGIYRSRQFPEFYINQRVANKILHLDNERILSSAYYDSNKELGDYGYQIDPYNGFFTKNANPKIISNTLALYPITGLGSANDKFYSDTKSYINLVKNMFSEGSNFNNYYQILSKKNFAYALGFINTDTMEVDIDKFDQYVNEQRTLGKSDEQIASLMLETIINTYGNDAYFSLINNVDSIDMYKAIFDNTSFLTTNLLSIILSIIAIISSLSVFSISLDLLNSSLGLSSMLKALGFSDGQNVISFTSIFIPSLLIAIAISIPLSIFIFATFKQFIYGFSNILLSLGLTWWIPFISLGIIGIVIVILMLYYRQKLKKKSIPESIARY